MEGERELIFLLNKSYNTLSLVAHDPSQWKEGTTICAYLLPDVFWSIQPQSRI